MNSTKVTGDRGEELAAEFLKKKGYLVKSRNYRAGRLGEIDIVAEKENTLVFVEVKTQRRGGFGSPEGWVNKRKQKRLGNVALHYLQENEIDGMDCRFDVVTLNMSPRKPVIHHIENAFCLESEDFS